ncbi:unnamed protein product [Trichobilharzia regenti]|nr:unnamed protein product [Trichobilharzia regenti]
MLNPTKLNTKNAIQKYLTIILGILIMSKLQTA